MYLSILLFIAYNPQLTFLVHINESVFADCTFLDSDVPLYATYTEKLWLSSITDISMIRIITSHGFNAAGFMILIMIIFYSSYAMCAMN